MGYIMNEECSTIINTTTNAVTKSRYDFRRGDINNISNHIPKTSRSKKLLTVVFDEQCNYPILLEDKDILIISRAKYNYYKNLIEE